MYLMNVNTGTSATCSLAVDSYPCDPSTAADDVKMISEWMAQYCQVSCGVCSYPADSYEKVEVDMMYNGEPRYFITKLPDEYDSEVPSGFPMTVMFHGGVGWAVSFYEQHADLHALNPDMIFIYPEGQIFGYSWESGVDLDENTDDVEFITTCIESAIATFNVDESRVYGYGYSQGGAMMMRTACETDKLSKMVGFVPYYDGLVFDVSCGDLDSGYSFEYPGYGLYTYYPWDMGACDANALQTKPKYFECDAYKENPIPTLFFNGMMDTDVPWTGSVVDGGIPTMMPPPTAVAEMFNLFGGCSDPTLDSSVDIAGGICSKSSSCQTSVELCVSETGQHFEQTWDMDLRGYVTDFLCADGGCEVERSEVRTCIN